MNLLELYMIKELAQDFNETPRIIKDINLNTITLIYPHIAVEHAISELSNKEEYSDSLFNLACVYKNESVYPYLSDLADLELNDEDGVFIKEKWMYLILDWIYNNKNNFPNSLDVVEYIYSDFDYPRQISSFVKYMPSDEPDLGSLELNESRLYRKWNEYLDNQV